VSIHGHEVAAVLSNEGFDVRRLSPGSEPGPEDGLHVGHRSDVGNGVTPDYEHVGVGASGYPAFRPPSPMALAAMVVAARRACSGVIPICSTSARSA